MTFYSKHLVDMVRDSNKGILTHIWTLNEKRLSSDNHVCLIKKQHFHIFHFNGFWLKYRPKYWSRTCGIYVSIVTKRRCLHKLKIYTGRLSQKIDLLLFNSFFLKIWVSTLYSISKCIAQIYLHKKRKFKVTFLLKLDQNNVFRNWWIMNK